MGLLAGLFGGEKEHPSLDGSHPVRARLERDRALIEKFASRVGDRLEVVPGEHGPYIFVGKPPKTFGVAWFREGVEQNLRLLMNAKGLSPATVQTVSDDLRAAYTRAQSEPRYSYDLAGRKIVVTPSADLHREVDQIIGAVAR